MNFYKKLKKEFETAGLTCAIVKVPDELIPTNDDYAKLEKNIAVKIRENENMMFQSRIEADRMSL